MGRDLSTSHILPHSVKGTVLILRATYWIVLVLKTHISLPVQFIGVIQSGTALVIPGIDFITAFKGLAE